MAHPYDQDCNCRQCEKARELDDLLKGSLHALTANCEECGKPIEIGLTFCDNHGKDFATCDEAGGR